MRGFVKEDKHSLIFATLRIIRCLPYLCVELPPWLMHIYEVLDDNKNWNDTNISIGNFHWNNMWMKISP